MNTRSGKTLVASLVLWGLVLLTMMMIAAMIAVLASRPEEALPEASEKPVAVRTMVVEERELPLAARLPGRVESWVDAVLSAEKGGRVVEVAFEKGDMVRKGDVLLRIDARAEEAVLRRAGIEKREAGRALERWKDLRAAGAVADSDFDRIKQRSDMADVAVEEAKVFVSKSVLSSPMAGTVEDRMVEVGEFVHEGGPLFRVVNIDRVKVAVDVPERDAVGVLPGRDVVFHVLSLAERSFTGTVCFVSSAARVGDNSFRTEIAVANRTHDLKPGMIAEVLLVRDVSADVIAVPLAAVVPQKGEHVVFAVSEGLASRRVVRLDEMAGSYAVISSGIRAGDEIVIEGHRTLQDGMAVVVKNETEATAGEMASDGDG